AITTRKRIAMPGRYFLVPPESQTDTLLPESFGRDVVEKSFARPRYNLAPSQSAPILRVIDGNLVVSDMHWGFAPRWLKDPSKAQINARSESVFDKPMFKHAANAQRCLVPVSGWYEWQPTANGKQPWALHRAG